MIIFGTRGVTYTAKSGDFHCPKCSSHQPYRQKRVRRFFTLYFIPMIPLDLHGEYVECQRCRGTYRADVLSYDPNAANAEFQAEFHRTIKLVMARMVLADGVVDDSEVEVICDIYNRLTNSDMSEREARREIAEVEHQSDDLATLLSKCAGFLNDEGKEMVVRAAFLIAAADGEFQDEEKELLGTIGGSLGMTSAHFNGVLNSMCRE